MHRPRWLVLVVLLAACSEAPHDTVYFELDASLADAAVFWDFPFPSDLRLDATGAPDLTGFPNRRNVPILEDLLSIVPERRGFPVMPTAYVRFTAPVPAREIGDVLSDDLALLVDIDPASPELGRRVPIVAHTLATDDYATTNLVALAPRPGFVLRAGTEYAYVIVRAFAPGFQPPGGFADLAAGRTPGGKRGAAAAALYRDLWPALDAAGIATGDVLVATVFTTGDEVGRTRARSEAIRAAYHPTITNLQLVGGATYDGFCRLSATITMPQFQTGTPPFDTGGVFVLDGDDVPMKQGDLTSRS